MRTFMPRFASPLLSALRPLGAGVCLALAGLSAQADEYHCPSFLIQDGAPAPSHRGEFTLSPYTHHWHHSDEHKPVVLVALDEQLPGGRLCGMSLFSNSFGQPTAYVYAGQQFNGLWGRPEWFLKLTGGIMYGYVGKYQHKVPMNHHGFSPVIIPSLGYKFTEHDSVQVKLLGTAGVMFSWGRQF